ncbi:hypothetical protein [Ornithinibacillus halophilus]|uniref:Voltage-gated potassium channel n=1 Tax=Ornithinibacillus halophilus TaxID=930117 RepID=A0A1M5IHN8_9BACI|nr:hypothetical protein [Ornithinibacillus halophilus]SHG27771.1 voltage-gated potassium channel [Ornithinibacillus halophilus]
MKANEEEKKKFDKALDDILELFNNLEEDEPIIKFTDDVFENIELAKKKYGDETVDEKINTVVREMLSWLDLDEDNEDEKEAEEETEEEEK